MANIRCWKIRISKGVFCNKHKYFIKNLFLIDVMASTLMREYPQKKWHKKLVEKIKKKMEKMG